MDGWVSGPGLFQTVDGGRTWSNTGLSGAIGPVAPAGTRAWALQYPCGQADQCTPRLIESSLPGGAWLPATQQPPFTPNSMDTLLRVTPTKAFITGVAPPQGVSTLFRTVDDGATWQSLANPCSSSLTSTLASLDGDTVWIICGVEPSAGNESKQVFISTNGAQSWSLKASVDIGDTSSGGLPSQGYVSTLALTSSSTGFLALSRYGLAEGTAAGSAWQELGSWDGAGGSFRGLWFVNAQDGWAAPCDGLHRTVDGGATWFLVATWPASGPC